MKYKALNNRSVILWPVLTLSRNLARRVFTVKNRVAIRSATVGVVVVVAGNNGVKKERYTFVVFTRIIFTSCYDVIKQFLRALSPNAQLRLFWHCLARVFGILLPFRFCYGHKCSVREHYFSRVVTLGSSTIERNLLKKQNRAVRLGYLRLIWCRISLILCRLFHFHFAQFVCCLVDLELLL